MPEIEQIAYEQILRALLDRLDATDSGFLARQKRQGQAEVAVANFVEALLAFFMREQIAPGGQLQWVDRCVRHIQGEERVSDTGLAARLDALLEPIAAPPVPAYPSSVSKGLENISFDVSDFTEPAPEEVAFTSMYPREVGVETWNTLLVYAHLTSALESVRRDAERFKDQLFGQKETSTPASTLLARGTELTIIPQCEGVTFNPKRITLAWLEDFQRTEFRFRADSSLLEDAARGRIDIFIGPLLVASLKLGFLVSAHTPQQTEPKQEQASMYHQDDIFISYSHRDTEIVLAFKQAYEAIGNNVLIDIDNLRAGQEWNAELMRMIERAEIFQLFWSENSSQSKYCQQEWEYALKLNRGVGFIRPCYFKTPMPAPPETLGHLHFEYVPFGQA